MVKVFYIYTYFMLTWSTILILSHVNISVFLVAHWSAPKHKNIILLFPIRFIREKVGSKKYCIEFYTCIPNIYHIWTLTVFVVVFTSSGLWYFIKYEATEFQDYQGYYSALDSHQKYFYSKTWYCVLPLLQYLQWYCLFSISCFLYLVS